MAKRLADLAPPVIQIGRPVVPWWKQEEPVRQTLQPLLDEMQRMNLPAEHSHRIYNKAYQILARVMEQNQGGPTW